MLRLFNVGTHDHAAIARLEAYLAANEDPGVRLRPHEMLAAALATGLALGVEDETNGAMVACSLVYRFDEVDAVSEIGTQRVTLNGHGLQSFLASLHLLQLRFELADERTTTFAVVSPGTASDHNLSTVVGMKPWDPPRTLIEARARCGVPFIGGKKVLVADDGTVAHAFEAMRGWQQGGATFRCPRRDVPIRIDAGWFEPGVLKIA